MQIFAFLWRKKNIVFYIIYNSVYDSVFLSMNKNGCFQNKNFNRNKKNIQKS